MELKDFETFEDLMYYYKDLIDYLKAHDPNIKELISDYNEDLRGEFNGE